MSIFLIILLTSIFGYVLTLAVKKEAAFLERVGLAFPLGAGLLTFLIFLYSQAGVQINKVSILITLLLIILFSKIFIKKKTKTRFEIGLFKRMSIFEKVIIFLILILIMASFISTLYWPVNEWDALALYDFRAKIIAQTGYFKQLEESFDYFFHYPLLTSLSHSIVYIFGGKNPQFIYSLFYLSFILIFFTNLRKFSSMTVSLVMTLLLASIPTLFVHSTLSYTNLPYTLYIVSGFIYLFNFLKKQKQSDILLSGILIGLSTWARDVEPFWMAGLIIIIAYTIVKKKIKPILLFLVSFLAIQQPWKYYLSGLFGEGRLVTNQVTQATTTIIGNLDVSRFYQVVLFLYEYTLLRWGIISALFIVVLLAQLKSKEKQKNILVFVIILINFLILFAGTYVFSINYPGWELIPDSATRMTMFFPPLLLFYIGTSDVFTKILNNSFSRLKRL